MKKEIISESRLREIISEEAARFKKKLTLEAEKKKLLKRLNEMYMEEDMMEESEMEEGLLKSLGQAAKAVGQTAKAVVLPAKAAKDDALSWIASQDQNLVNQAKAQDKQAYENLKLAFRKELSKNDVAPGYEHLYLTPFFAEFGALGKADQAHRDKAYVASAGIKTGSNAE